MKIKKSDKRRRAIETFETTLYGEHRKQRITDGAKPPRRETSLIDHQALAVGVVPSKNKTVFETVAEIRAVLPGAPQKRDAKVRVLIALADYPHGLTVRQIALAAKIRKGTAKNYVGDLKRLGHVAKKEHGKFAITETGKMMLPADYKPLPKGDALRALWKDKLPEGEALIFETLEEFGALTLEEIAERTRYSAGSVKNYLGYLKARELVRKLGDQFRLSPDLFLDP